MSHGMLGAKHRSDGMPIEAYLPTSGASFGPEAVANMGKALEGAVDILGIGPSDETKREAVARFIIKLAEIDGGVDAATLAAEHFLNVGCGFPALGTMGFVDDHRATTSPQYPLGCFAALP